MVDKRWLHIFLILAFSGLWVLFMMTPRIRHYSFIPPTLLSSHKHRHIDTVADSMPDSSPRHNPELGTRHTDVFNITQCPSDVTMDTELMLSSLGYLLEGLNTSRYRSMNGTGPIDGYMSDYRNPCWLESVPHNYSYSSSIYTSTWPAVGERRRTQFVYKQMEGRYRARYNTSGVGWRVRCLPYLFIVGMYKAGTTDFYTNLVSHKLVEGISIKEPYFWTNLPPVSLDPNFQPLKKYGMETFEHYLDLYDKAADNIRQYRDKRSSFHPKITVDAATWTFFGYRQWAYHPWNRHTHTLCISLPQHISYLSPSSHVIMLLRHPVTWLTSCYNHHRMTHMKNKEHHSPADLHRRVTDGIQWFEGCVRRHHDNPGLCMHDARTSADFCHVKFTVYYLIVKEWTEAVGTDKIKIINSEVYFRDRVPVVNAALKFLKLPELDRMTARRMRRRRVLNAGSRGVHVRMLPETVELLTQFQEPWKEKLARFLNDDSYMWKEPIHTVTADNCTADANHTCQAGNYSII